MSRKRPVEDDAPPWADESRKKAKKLRDYSDEDAKVAVIFNDLANEVKDVRMQAVRDLLQKCTLLVEKPDSDLAEPKLRYGTIDQYLVRLVRGLCSSAKAARYGFFVALTEVICIAISKQPAGSKVFVTNYLELVKKETCPASESGNQEKREFLIGRLSSYSAVLQSGVLFNDSTAPDDFKLVLDALSKIPMEAPWLREDYGSTLCTTIEKMSKIDDTLINAQTLLDTLSSHSLERTPEGVAMWIELNAAYPTLKKPKGVWEHSNPLSKKEVARVARIMTQNISVNESDDASKPKQSHYGARQASPNFAWEIVVRGYERKDLQDAKLQKLKPKMKDLSRFWLEAFDNGYFAPSASSEKKSLGFQVLCRMLEVNSPVVLRAAFTPNLIKCLVNHGAKAERYLHSAAKNVLKSMVLRAVKDKDAAYAIFDALAEECWLPYFDKLTASKTIFNIVASVDVRHVDKLAEVFRSEFLLSRRKDLKEVESDRSAIADQFLSWIKNNTGQTSSLIDMLMINSLSSLAQLSLSIDEKANPPVSDRTRELVWNRLSSALAHVVSKGSNMHQTILNAVVIVILDPSQSFHVVQLADEEVQKTISQGITFVSGLQIKKLRSISKATKEKGRKGQLDANKATRDAFQLLCNMTIFHVLHGDADAISIISELEELSEQLFPKSGKAASDVADVLMEIIISYASKNSVLHRKLAEQIYTAFAHNTTERQLESMFDILAQKENLAGQQTLFEKQDDAPDAASEAISEDEEDDEQDENSVEEVTNSSGDDLEEDDNASEISDVSEPVDNQAELAELDEKLANVLKAREDGNDSSSDSSMDDEQMLALEPHLSEIFRQRAAATSRGSKVNPKLEQKNAKLNIVNFKNRVLDLLLIFAKTRVTEESQILCFKLIMPLLHLIRTTSNKQVADKAGKVLATLFDTCKKHGIKATKDGLFAKKEENHSFPSIIEEQLQEIHDEVLNFSSKNHATMCSRSSLFVARVAYEHFVCESAKENGSKTFTSLIWEFYGRTMQRSMDAEKGSVSVSFFNDLNTWLHDIKGNLSKKTS